MTRRIVLLMWMAGGWQTGLLTQAAEQPAPAPAEPAPVVQSSSPSPNSSASNTPAPASPDVAVKASTNAPGSDVTNAAPPAQTASEAAAPSSESNPSEKAAPAQPSGSNPAEAASKSEAPPAAMASASSSAERNIRFQFDGIPYMDVLERFAQMVHKPLVADTRIEGTLTFNDPRPYTYGEALDTLNVILSMKGVMLVETDHYLRLVELKDLSQMPLPILRGLDSTGDVRPGEVVTVVLDLKNLEARETAEAVRPLLSKAGSVAPLSRGRGLIITDRLANIQRVRQLISIIDSQSVAQQQMRTYTLFHASGAVVAQLINRTFGESTAPKRTQFNEKTKRLEVLPPDPNDYITAVFDEGSRTLVLYGPKDRLDMAEELIQKFEEKEGSAGEVRIYYPGRMSATELANMIRQAVPGVAGPGESPAAAATKARLIVDATQNRLIVAAPTSGQLEVIENLIRKVDAGTRSESGTGALTRSEAVQLTKVFRPRTLDPSSLARILTEALTQRSPSGTTVPLATVAVEPASQTVVVTGSPGAVQTAVDIVAQLETEPVSEPEVRTRYFDVGSASEAKRLLPLVEQIYRNQIAGDKRRVAKPAQILADEPAGRLIVVATETDLKQIEGIIQTLTEARPEPKPRRLHLVALKHLRADQDLKRISDLITQRMEDPRFADQPKPLLLPDSANNRLLVTATDEQFQEIEQVIQVLDVAPEKPQRQMVLVPVHSKPARDLIQLATQLLSQVVPEPQDPQLAPKLLADPSGKQVIVLATERDLPAVRKLIEQLDASAAPAAQRQFRSIELYNRKAEELTPLVQQLYQEQLKGLPEPAGGPATLMAESRLNRIMVSGTPEEITRVETIIRQLDPAGAERVREETRVLRLQHGRAVELSSLVEKSLNAQAHKVNVLVDERSNSLVVTGQPDAVAAAAQLIEQLDARSETQPRELRIIEVKSGDAGKLVPLVTSLFTEMMQDERGPTYKPQAKVLPDNTGNRMVVSGPRDEVETIAGLVQKLDHVPESAGGARVFQLRHAQAATVAPIISNVMTQLDYRGRQVSRVSVSVDEASNTLIVSGSREDLQDVETIVQKLEGEGPALGRQLRVIDVQSENPQELAGVVMKVFAAQGTRRNVEEQVSITPEPSGRRLIVLAPAEWLPQIEQLIKTLDSPPPEGRRQLHLIDVPAGSAQKLLTTVNRIYTEQRTHESGKPASIYPDASNSRLAVWGTEQQAETIRQIVQTLQVEPKGPRETKIFELGRREEAERVMPLLQKLYQDRVENDPKLAPADAQILQDGRSGRLIVSARQEHLALIEELLGQLKVASTNQPERETRAFPVGNAADVQRLLPLVQQLYQEQWKDKGDDDPADAKILGDERGGRLIVTGRPEHVKQIEAIVRQLTGGASPTPVRSTHETRVFNLTHANAAELATTVRTLYEREARERLGSIKPDVLILPDPTSNRLILSAESTELDAIEAILKKLDEVSPENASTRVIKLKTANAYQVSQLLSQALVRRSRYGRIEPRVSIGADPVTQTLILSGEPADLQAASDIIQKLDAPAEQAARTMRVVPIETGSASALATQLEQLYQDRTKSQPEAKGTEPLIMADPAGNQLILAGTQEQLSWIESTLQQLQSHQPGREPRQTRTLPVDPNVSLDEVLTLVQQLYQEQWRNRPPADPADAQILPDREHHRFIVTGRPAHLDAIAAILQDLTRDVKEPAPRETRVYTLTQARATELATTVRSLYQEELRTRTDRPKTESLILPDETGNRLIVSAETNELARIDRLIQKLEQAASMTANTRVVRLQHANPETVARLLSQAMIEYNRYGRAVPQISIGTDTESRRLILTGEPQHLQTAAQIIEQLDTVDAGEARSMRVVRLKAHRASELLRKVQELYRDQRQGHPELGATDPVILDEPVGNQLILAGTEAQLALLEQIIEQLQKPIETQPPRETRTFRIGQADEVQRVQSLVQQLYQDEWKDRAAADPADAVILADTRNGQLIVSGKRTHLEAIAALIDKVRAQIQQAGPRETRIYDLSATTATELATTVRTLYEEQLKDRAQPPVAQALILPDAAANRLVVSGPSNELARIDAIVQKLDKADAQAGRTRLFQLKTARAEQVASVLSTALVKMTPYGRPVPLVTVGTDPQNNLLIVSGEPKDLQSATLIIEQLDQAAGQETRQMRILPIKSGAAADLAEKLTQIYREQKKGQGAADALILSDEENNRLIITADAQDMKRIEQLFEQLQETGPGVARELKVFTLQRNSASSVATMLSQLFAREMGSQDPSRHLVVSTSGDDKAVVVEAPQETMQRIGQLIESIDGEGAAGQVEVRTYAFPGERVVELADSLRRLFQQREERRPSRSAGPAEFEPRFEADASADLLMVAATPTQFKQIEQLILELKKAAPVANEIRTFLLKHADAEQVANVLQEMLSTQDRRSRSYSSSSGSSSGGYYRSSYYRPGMGWRASSGADTVRVAPAPSQNAVVVQGPPDTLALAEKLIQTLDQEQMDRQSVIQAVQLKKGDPETIAQAIADTLSGRRRSFPVPRGTEERFDRVRVSPVVGSKSLLISGPPAEVQEIIQVIHQLDQESTTGGGIEVRIYKLENGNARECSRVLEQLLQNVTRAEMQLHRGESRRYLPASVSVDERSNALIVSGTPSHFQVVDQVLPTLDRVPERTDQDVEFIWLQNADATDVATQLNAVFATRPKEEQPVIEADLFSNSITVIGRRGDVAQVRDLISRLDAASRDTSLQVRLRPLDRIAADQMARMLQNIYPQMSVGRIRIVEKIQPLPVREKPAVLPGRAVPSPAAPPSTNAAPAAAPQTNQVAAVPEVVIAVDKEANALILSGPANELDQIDSIIADLTFSVASPEAELRLVPLQEADPVNVAKILNELFKQPPVQVQQPQGKGKEGPKGQPQVQTVTPPPKVTVVAEPRTRSVIVRAKATDFPLIESLIKQLDSAQVSSQLQYRLVPVTNAPPEKVLPLVQQMVKQLNLVQPGEPLNVSVDARNRGLLVVARDTVIERLEQMIRSLDLPSEYAEAEVLVLPLKQASATQLATVLQNMLKPGPQGEVTPEARELQEQVRRLRVRNSAGQAVTLDLTKPIKILPDPVSGNTGGNRLVLTSTPDNLKALEAVVRMMDTLPVVEGLTVRLVPLEHADADTVAQTLTRIFTEAKQMTASPSGPGQPEEPPGKALAHPPSVATDARSNSLIISGRPEAIDLAERIIHDLDKPVDRFITEVRLFKLKHASASAVLPILQGVFAEGGGAGNGNGAAARRRARAYLSRLRLRTEQGQSLTSEESQSRAALVLQADDTANLLIVAARSDTLPLIEELIRQLDIPEASGLSKLRIYPLDHADATAVQSILNDLFAGPRGRGVRRDERPNIAVDARGNALIVAGTEKAFGIIEGLIAQLDTKLPIELRDIRILPLEQADAVELAGTLQRLMDARVTQQAALGKGQAESLRVLIIGEPRSNSLLIGGSKDSYELVQTLARQLDQTPPALSGRVRLVPLKYADARTLSLSLSRLFSRRSAMTGAGVGARTPPVIVADPRSNSLLVAAGVDDHKALDELVAKLDRPLEDPSMVLTVVGLRHNEASRVAPALQNIFTARLESRTVPGTPPSPQEQVRIEVDTLNNSLIVYASKENLEILQGLVEKLDVEPTPLEGVVQSFPLRHADAQRVANMLRSLVQQGIYRPGAPPASTGAAATQREAMAVTVDPRSNTLIVSASPENMVVIKELLRQIDTPEAAETANIRLYPLKHARASTLATILRQFFQARRLTESVGVSAAERSVPVTVTADDRTNTLLITGGKESFDILDRIIQQLDGEDVMAKMNFQVFPLKRTTATKLQSTLQQLFANRPPRVQGEPPEPITIVADPWVNALIVGAAPEDLRMVESLIEKLDSQQQQAGVEVQILPLSKADARRVAQTIQGLYREGATGATAPVVVSADERLNAVIVSAGANDAQRIAELVKKLDTERVGRVSEIRVIPLKYARAEALASILNAALNAKPTPLTEQSPNTQSLLQFITRTEDGREVITSALKEGVLITSDTRMNALIVSAPVDYMDLLDQIISRLDDSSPRQAKIKVFTLTNADAGQTADLLLSLFRLQPSGTTGTQRSILYKLVRPAATDGTGEEELASAVLGSEEESALTVTVDPRTNSLLVGGTDHYIDLVSKIIETLDSSTAMERRTEVYRLKNSQAADVQTAVSQFLDQERQRITQVLGAEAVGTAQRLLDREVAIVAEPTSNALLLSASPRYFEQIRQMITQLDQPQPQVLIQAVLAEVTLDNTTDLGLEWSYQKALSGDSDLVTGTDFGVLGQLQNFGGYSAVLTGGDASFVLRALENSGRLELLSRPQIVTADNIAASISIGQRVPLITGSQVTPQGGTVSTFNYEEVGVVLTVTPRITGDGFVKIEVGTTNSALSSSAVQINDRGTTVPIINQRRASTTVTVQSGQTVLIGGLIGTTDDTRVKKIPVLGSIPYLGTLFRSTTKIRDRKELLILLTPLILTQSVATVSYQDYDVFTRQQLQSSPLKDQLERDELQRRVLEPILPKDTPGGAATRTNLPPAAPKPRL